MDMVAEVAVEELERLFPGFKIDKKSLKYSWKIGMGKTDISHPLKSIVKTNEYAMLSDVKKVKVHEYVNFIVSVARAEKLKKKSRIKSCS